MKSILFILLSVQDRSIGYVEIYESRHSREFTIEEIVLCQAISYHAAAALENSRLYQETQRHLNEQTVLYEAGAAISSALDFKTVLTQIATQMCSALNATSAYICNYDAKFTLSEVLAEHISNRACDAEKISDLNSSYSSDDTLDREFVKKLENGLHDISLINDEGISNNERAHMQQYGVKSILYIPLTIKNIPVGFVEIWESRFIREFTSDEISLCKTIPTSSHRNR